MKVDPKAHGHALFGPTKDRAAPMRENTDRTGGDPVVAAEFRQVDEATAKSVVVAAHGTRMSPPPGAAPPPANVVPKRNGGAR